MPGNIRMSSIPFNFFFPHLISNIYRAQATYIRYFLLKFKSTHNSLVGVVIRVRVCQQGQNHLDLALESFGPFQNFEILFQILSIFMKWTSQIEIV